MVHPQHIEPVGPLDRLLELIGVRHVVPAAEKAEETKAVKCDLCRDSAHGPACVRICPTGAATRVSPNEYFKGIGVGVR
jgi:Fe-S-cluster-containing hydrogenase component 2